jgi:hypothetical protein
LSPSIKEETIQLIERSAYENGAAEAAAGSFFEPGAGLGGALAGEAGSADVDLLQTGISAIAKDHSGEAYMWPFLVGTITSLLNLPLAFRLGRRLGDQKLPTASAHTGGTIT